MSATAEYSAPHHFTPHTKIVSFKVLEYLVASWGCTRSDIPKSVAESDTWIEFIIQVEKKKHYHKKKNINSKGKCLLTTSTLLFFSQCFN